MNKQDIVYHTSGREGEEVGRPEEAAVGGGGGGGGEVKAGGGSGGGPWPGGGE